MSKYFLDLSNRELGEQLRVATKEEREKTTVVLNLIDIANEKRAYLELGFPSLFEWLTRGFGYSNAAAYRRIEAARLLNSVPEIAEKLESGLVNLSTISKLQSVLKAQEKVSGIACELKD